GYGTDEASEFTLSGEQLPAVGAAPRATGPPRPRSRMASRSSKQSIRARWFKNDKKEKPSHPDYRGDATTRGRKFWVSTWIKTSEKTGKRFMSLAFRGAGEPPAKPKPKAPTDTDADIIQTG